MIKRSWQQSSLLSGVSWLVGCLSRGEVKPAPCTCAGAAGDHFRTAPLSCFGFVFYFWTIFLTFHPRGSCAGTARAWAAAASMAARWRHRPAAASVRGPRGPEGAAGRERAGKRGVFTIFPQKGRSLVFDLRVLSSLISRKGDFRNSS